ncbi:Cytochrome P450 monooxygenase 91 [Psilocybe cubensis]|uniref:Cytochrome P450 monooxygenase 91 n=2 Tax=Psilocybe cubensis TaxID=181762 RepID=A0ACB8GJR1_PSICU|nr:Cytochrome P450 monooxygenase 91 [Psilocybe cubensis]KAH9475309.1 Cytochrome P450 monooxygenase 91 [Psilocybe cubensis]
MLGTFTRELRIHDQDIFEETTMFIRESKLLFGPGILSSLGEQHRKQRKMLNPVFSIAHMREMVPIFYDVTHKLRDTILEKVKNSAQEIDLLPWMKRTALELIGQSGLGYSFDSLKEDEPSHPYYKSTQELVPVASKMMFARMYLGWTTRVGPPKIRRAIVNLLPWKAAHKIRDITDTMYNTSVEILNSKRQALDNGDEAVRNQIGQGKDILSILLRANMSASGSDRLSDEEVIGQMSSLTFAATDTTSAALSRVFHLLAKHPDAQARLREEIIEARARYGGDIPYDELVVLPYLDAIAVRLSGFSIAMRVARKDVSVPLSSPIKGTDGQTVTEIFVPKNTKILIGILAANRNPELWGPDSYEWKPERWLEPLPETVTNARLPGIYANLMTFLGGSRACIGFKFSQLEMKVVLSLLIESFKVALPDKEIVWQMDAVATPTISDVPNPQAQLPLIMSLASGSFS